MAGSTVIMIQVENEVGMHTVFRDHSPVANQAIAGPVPKELMDYLQRHKDTLIPEFRQAWGAAGLKTSGTWEEVFGKGSATDGLFMAWYYASYIGRVVAAGKAEYSLPMYVNAALYGVGKVPRFTPSGGRPWDLVMDVWKAGGPQIDFFSPDIYSQTDFVAFCAKYTQSGNPLFIPETRYDMDSKLLYVFGRHDAIGLALMGVERATTPDAQLITGCEMITQLAPLIAKHQGDGSMSAVMLAANDPPQNVKVGNYTLQVARMSPRPSAPLQPGYAAALFIAVGPDEYYAVGNSVRVTFSSNTPGPEQVGIGTVEEGTFVNGRWVPSRQLAGDETGQGDNLSLRSQPVDRIPGDGYVGIQHFTLYRYRYSRNLDSENGKGIELIYLPPEKLPAPAKTARPETAIATVPAAQTPTSVTSKGTPASGDLPKAGLEAWFSAGRVEQTDGTITQILDLSGNANHARREPPTAAPASNPALAEDAASGQPVLRFTGANIAFAFKRLTDIRTAFWVVSKDPASFGKRSEKFVLGDRNSNDFHAGWTSDTIFNTDVNPGHVSKFMKDGKTWLNGQSMDATKTPFPSQLSLISIVSAGPVRAGQLAQDRNFSGRSWQGEIAEILLYNVELSEADRQAVEKYLIAKYKIKPGIKPDTAVHPMAPAVLPGKGPAQHPFLYAGEWDTRKPQEQSMFIVRGGKVVWQYAMPLRTPSGGIQEFDDATLLSDGNIVFSRMSGAGMVSPDKKLVWEYPAPAGTEIHSCQPIGKDRVLIMRNGNLAQAMIINTATGKIEKEIRIPTTVKGTHGQFRHIRMTKAGTILVPHMSEGKVVEYDLDGKEVWSVKTRSPWSAVRLNSGNTLIAGDASKYVREVNPKGETVWELTQADVPDIKLFNTQTANRLANGNTVVCNWCAGNNRTQEWAGTVQIFEVTPDKKVVWALSSWKDPDLGPSTSIQLLDEPGAREDQER